jgi:hypothetical protein
MHTPAAVDINDQLLLEVPLDYGMNINQHISRWVHNT